MNENEEKILELQKLLDDTKENILAAENQLKNFECCINKDVQEKSQKDKESKDTKIKDLENRLNSLKSEIPDFKRKTYNKYKEYFRLEQHLKKLKTRKDDFSQDFPFDLYNLEKQIMSNIVCLVKQRMGLEQKLAELSAKPENFENNSVIKK